jgi:hypothetical protein
MSDARVPATAATKLAPAVLKWLADDTCTLDSVINDLQKAIRYEADGYDVAKHLESEGYTPDAELVEILNDVAHHKHQALYNLEKTWVAEQGLVGPSVSTIVEFKHQGKTIQGEVTENTPTGKSVVFCESLGHVRSGKGNGTLGLHVAWESLRVITPATSASRVVQLHTALQQEWEQFQRLPKKGSFSGLAIAERIDKLQQELDVLGDKGVRHQVEINVEVG